MYLSRIPLDVSKRKTQAALVSPSKIHGAVEGAFSERQGRNLWRIDTLQGKTYLLILSVLKPDLWSIADQFGYQGICGESKEYERLLCRIKEGSIWNFRLVANPTCSAWREGERGKITAYLQEDKQLEWLVRQSEKKGFYVFLNTVRLSGADWKIFQKRGTGPNVRILQVTFEGRLKVEKPDVFKKALIEGIGREKAYGMGLLTVAGGRV